MIDITAFVNGADDRETCALVSNALEMYGCLIVRDPRVSSEANDAFLDMMERYFEQSDGSTDARPHLHYQVGVTPANVEKPRDHCARAAALPEGHRPMSECPPIPDAKWRFFWRVGARPAKTAFAELNAPAVVPAAIEDWVPTMDGWGESLVATARTVAEMAALGFGRERGAFADLMADGPHLLAPTGASLASLAAAPDDEPPLRKPRLEGDAIALGTVLAGFHYDLNFLTVHGKSRFPGLTVWRRDGVSCAPAVPKGCLLVQAGKQLEILTGGAVQAGFHEVVATAATKAAAKVAQAASASTWRVSSTCFAHVASDQTLAPLAGSRFDTLEAREAYPPLKAGDQVQAELEAIALGASSQL